MYASAESVQFGNRGYLHEMSLGNCGPPQKLRMNHKLGSKPLNLILSYRRGQEFVQDGYRSAIATFQLKS